MVFLDTVQCDTLTYSHIPVAACTIVTRTHTCTHTQAKVNNQGQIGSSYTQSLRTGVKLGLSCLVEGRNINAGGHKLGVSIDFES